MTLIYGFLKCKIKSAPTLASSRRRHETQYHLHATLKVDNGSGQTQSWDTAINVGTNDADDLLRYRLVYDFHHPILDTLKNASSGFMDLTGTIKPPALDFLRSDILSETGSWRDSDVMDGTEHPEPVASLLRLLQKAHADAADVYVFGRKYTDGTLGIHDIHMNQGSSGSFVNNGADDHNDHNDIWQDGAVIVDLGEAGAAGYFTVFTQQLVPTDTLGNPTNNGHEVGDADPNSITS